MERAWYIGAQRMTSSFLIFSSSIYVLVEMCLLLILGGILKFGIGFYVKEEDITGYAVIFIQLFLTRHKR